MKLSWTIIKYNFSLYKIYYLIFTILLGFCIAILLTTRLALDDKGMLDNVGLNRFIFSIFWIIAFFDYVSLVNKVFYKNIKNNQEQIMLFSKTTRQKLFLSNFLFLLFYAFSRMLLLFIVVAICYLIKPRFDIGDLLWMLFNITINSLFVGMLFVFICLLTFNQFDKQFLIFGILGAILLCLTVFMTLFSFSSNVGKVERIVSYIPIVGITVPQWMINNAWQQYLNLPISVLGSIALIIISIRLNQRIEY